MPNRSKSNPARDSASSARKVKAAQEDQQGVAQEEARQFAEAPTTPREPPSHSSAPFHHSSPTHDPYSASAENQAVDELTENLPTMLLKPLDEDVHEDTTRVAPVREFARRAAQWRAVTVRLRAEIAQLNDHLTQMRDQLTYAEVQAATYEQVARAMIQTQQPDEPPY